MLKVAVTDANIFIDLIILGLITQLFKLKFEIHTTREVYNQLNSNQILQIENFAHLKLLFVYNFDPEEIKEIQQLNFPAGLEPADRTVFYYARKFDTVILSGDNKLRKFCESKGLKVFGIIWIFDQLVELELISKNEAVTKLEKLMGYNDRLPIEEILKRLRKWKAN